MSVRADVRYLNEEWRHRDDRPFIYSRETRHANTSKHAVDIRDARSLVRDGALSVVDSGLTFRRHPVFGGDYQNEQDVRQHYKDVIEPMLLEATGAREAFVGSHQIRTEDPKTFLGAYSRYVHCDYPLHPTPTREQKLLSERNSAHASLAHSELRYAWFNIWEPIDRPARQNQLCVVDASSTSDDDFREYHFTAKAEGGYATLPMKNDRHRFYYFSNMIPGEAIIFKQFDSRKEHPMVCPHTSFFDDSVDEPLGRRSIEYRALCVY